MSHRTSAPSVAPDAPDAVPDDLPSPAIPSPDRRRAPRRCDDKRILDLTEHAWVTPEQIAEYYGVPLKTVKRKWIKEGLICATRFPGQNTRVKVSDLLKFEVAHQIVPCVP